MIKLDSIKKIRVKINSFGGNNNFKPSQIEQFMKDGSNTGKLYQLAIINKLKLKDMTKEMGSNSPFDSQRISENGLTINQEIRTLSKYGICWYEAKYMGSKSTTSLKISSTKKKLKILGKDGEFIVYDNTKWSIKNPYIDVYIIPVKLWKSYFGKNTFKTSYKNMTTFLKNNK